MNYAVFDLETDGLGISYLSVLQASGILINDDLQILDSFDLKSRLIKGRAFQPGAICANLYSPRELQNLNVSNYELVCQFNEYIKKWSPAIWCGWNTTGFDFRVVERMNLRNLFEPYALKLQGNKQTDWLPFARYAHHLDNNILEVPLSEKGKPSFKLEDLIAANKIKIEGRSHEAVQDCRSVISLMKILKEKAPIAYKSAHMTMSKQDAQKLIENENIFTHFEYFFRQSRVFVSCCMPFINHPVYSWIQGWDLRFAPEDYFDLSLEDLKKALSKSPKCVRNLKHNSSPLIMHAKFGLKFDPYKTIGQEKLLERAQLLKNNKDFSDKVKQALQEIHEDKIALDSQLDIPPEESLYTGGFASNEDKKIMEQFHAAENWENKFKVAMTFKDERFKYFGIRLCYENSENVLPKEIYDKIHNQVKEELLTTAETKHVNISQSYKEIDDKRIEYEEKNDRMRLQLLEEANTYLQDLEEKYKSA